MASEWVAATVGDVFDLVNGYAFKSADFIDAGVPVIKIKNVKAGEFSEHEFSYVSEEFLHNRANKLAQFGDLLISMSGNRHDGSPETWVGKVAQFRKSGNHFINQRVGALRIKVGAEIDGRFASYVLSSTSYQELFIAIATSSGGQANLSPAQILGAPIRYPKLPEQRVIAHILGTLDDKIELNRKQNETLEAMARALFKAWFVDFEPVRAKLEGRWQRGQSLPGLPAHLYDLFPDRLVDSKLGEIPEGWEVGVVDNLADISSGKRPEIRHSEASADVNVPLWGGNGPMAFVPSALIEHPILLTGRVGTLGVVFRITTPCWPSDNTLIVRAKDVAAFEYLFFQLRQIDFHSLNRGSTQPLLTQTDLKVQPLVMPPLEVLAHFHRATHSLYRQVDETHAESRTLAQLRDTLLPKLISGELRVADAEAFLKERNL